MIVLAIVLAAVVGVFVVTVLFGAPYVPTHRRGMAAALDLLSLKPGQVVVDLGSGDGSFLLLAAQRGLVAYGYEINPLLCVVTWLRALRYRGRVKVFWRNFWAVPLPASTKGVFVFAAGPFVERLVGKLERETGRHGLRVASYGYALPGHAAKQRRDGVNLYVLSAKP